MIAKALLRLALTVALALGVLAFITWWALESGGVARLETTRADGSVRETHVWWAIVDGDLYVEAGSPENGWYQDILSIPELRVVGVEELAHPDRWLAQPVLGDAGATERDLRQALAIKYGWRDRWVQTFVDAGESIAVRLLPIAHGADAPTETDPRPPPQPPESGSGTGI